MSKASRSTLLILTGARSTQGGVENIIDDLVVGLPKRGLSVQVAVGGGYLNDAERYKQTFPHQNVLVIDGRWGTRQSRLENLISTIEHVRPKVVLSARVGDSYEAVRLLKGRGRKIRYLTTIQAFEPHYLWDARIYEPIVDHVITSGEMIRRTLIDWAGYSPDRVTSIPGGVRKPIEISTRSYKTIPLRIGYVGRLEQPQKRILDLCSLVSILEEKGMDCEFYIVGAGPESIRLQQGIEGINSRNRFHFLGWMSRDRLYREIYPNLDILVHFAAIEGVTIAPREAMVHGVVPVISQFAGLKLEGHFRHGVNAMTFPVGNVELAAEHIDTLNRDRGFLARLSRAAMSSQTGKYGSIGALNAWEAVIRSVLGSDTRYGPVSERPPREPGRLDAWGVNPWLAHRIRRLLGIRYRHRDGGSEWPTSCQAMPAGIAAELEAFRKTYEE